jgi:RNA polymerase sigma factor (sigma-70 family)
MEGAPALKRHILTTRAPSGVKDPTLHSLADEAIARLAEHGSRRAFAALYERYEQRLAAYCHLLLNDAEDTHDALQSTLARALAELRRGERERPLAPWLFRIADEEATSLLRARAMGAGIGRASAGSEGSRSADDAAEERARLALLMADLRELPDVQRSALLMRELSGLSHEEIATALEISAHGARQAIFHARRSLVEFRQGRSLACEEVQRTISHDDGRTFRRRGVRAHLRDCGICTAFAASIPQRCADFQALAPPLAPMLAGGLAARLSHLGSGHGATGLTAGTAKTVGTSLAAKVLAATTIVVSAGAGLGTVNVLAHHSLRHAAAPVALASGRHARDAGGRARRAGSSSGRVVAGGGRGEESRAGAADPPAQDRALTSSPSDGGADVDVASDRGAAAVNHGPGDSVAQGPASVTAAGSTGTGGGAGGIEQQRQLVRAHGKPGTPQGHGADAPGPPRSAHAPAEPGGAAHLRAGNDSPPQDMSVAGVDASTAANAARAHAPSEASTEAAGTVLDSSSQSAQGSGPNPPSPEAPATAPETGVSSGAAAT